MNNLYMMFPRYPHSAPPQRGRSPWRPPHHGPRCFSAGCGSSRWQHECIRRALNLSLISGASFVLQKTSRPPVSLCSRLLGSSSPRRAPQTVCESPRRAEVGCRGSHSFGKAVGQAATPSGQAPREQAKVFDPESDLAERRVAAAAAAQLSFPWVPRYGLAAYPGFAPVATLELWRVQSSTTLPRTRRHTLLTVSVSGLSGAALPSGRCIPVRTTSIRTCAAGVDSCSGGDHWSFGRVQRHAVGAEKIG